MAGHIFQHIQDFITGLLRPRLLPREAIVIDGGAPAAVDPYWSSVVALLHFDGSNGGAIVDQTGKTWGAFAGAAINTSDKKFGTASLLLDGTADYLQTADHSDFAFGSGDWTVECFFKETTLGAFTQLVGQHSTAGESSSQFILYGASGVLSLAAYVGSTTYAITGSSSHSSGTWYHVAAVRDGGTLRLFRNGTSIGTVAISGSLNDVSEPVSLGALMGGGSPSGGYYMNGRIDDLRITKGVARYTANFTAPTAAFPDS